MSWVVLLSSCIMSFIIDTSPIIEVIILQMRGAEKFVLLFHSYQVTEPELKPVILTLELKS